MWSVKQVLRLCGLGEEHLLTGYVASGCIVLDKDVVTSIRTAVESLNAGLINCPQGTCIAYSASHQAYHMIYRSDMRDKVQSDFRRRSSSMASNFAVLDGAWSTKNVLRLCADGEEQAYLGVIPLLDSSSITSVMEAVCRLNRGDIDCPEGYCMVYSTSRQAYYLLYHCQVKNDVLLRFRPVDNGNRSSPPLGRSPSTSFNVSEVGAIGEDSWSSKRVVRLCDEGEENVFQGRAMLIKGSLSVSDAIAKLNRGDVDCPDGFCVVFSASRKSFFLLFRAGLRDIAIAACNGDVEPGLLPTADHSSSQAPYTSAQVGQYLESSSQAVSARRNRVVSQSSRNNSWSTKQAFKVCAEGDELCFQGRVHVLDRAQVTSVNEAVQILEGAYRVSEGLCMVFSAKQQIWYLLYRADMRENAVSLLADFGVR